MNKNEGDEQRTPLCFYVLSRLLVLFTYLCVYIYDRHHRYMMVTREDTILLVFYHVTMCVFLHLLSLSKLSSALKTTLRF